MAGTVSGTISLAAYVSELFAVGANVLTQYSIPVNLSPAVSYADGTAANQVHKFAMASGTLAATTIAFDLTSTSANMTMSDGTTSFSHVREMIIVNNSTTTGQYLYLDLTVANAFGVSTAGAGFIEGTMTDIKIPIQPGTNWFRWAKPIGTTGVVVDGTHKVIKLDSGAVSIAYQVLVIGD